MIQMKFCILAVPSLEAVDPFFTSLRNIALSLLLAVAPLVSRADVTLAPPFCDHAVLQCDKLIPIWGHATAGEAVTVSFHGQSQQAVAAADGRWQVTLGPFPANREPAELKVAGRNTVLVGDVLVGEVWVVSGQSNMEFPVSRGRQAEAEIAAADFPLIRELKIRRTVAGKPADTVPTEGWRLASPQTVGDFSAVGYFFARDLSQKLHVPVGIVNSTWGGTAIESWLSAEAREATLLQAVLAKRWQQALSEWPPQRVAEYPATYQRWEEAELKAKKNGVKNPLRWPEPPATTDSPALPGGLYNGMIAPLAPMALRGFLWYQGEGNAKRAQEYRELFTALIQSWRKKWNDDSLPFYFAQLPNYHDEIDPTDQTWAQLREAQAKVAHLPEVEMAVTIDIGEADDIHPKNKQELGRRFALIAEAKAYGVPVEYSGPVFNRSVQEGSALRLSFKSGDGQLQLRDGENTAFEIAGSDRIFHPASVKIDHDALLVSSPEATDPQAVRYAWSNAPKAVLFSGANLPAAPFRTDDWKSTLK